MRTTWHAATLAREVTLNLTALRSRRITILIVTILVGLCVPAVIAAEQHSLKTELSQSVENGWNVYRITSDSASIRPNLCRKTAELPGVIRAGAFDRAPFGMPQFGEQFQIGWVDRELVKHLNSPGPFISTTNDSTVVVAQQRVWAAQKTDDISRWGMGSVLLFPQILTEKAEQCIVELTPNWVGRFDHLPAAMIGSSGRVPQVVSDSMLASEFHPIDGYLQRPGRWFPEAAGIGLGIIYVALAISFRNQLSSYRVMGMDNKSMRIYYLAESLFCLAVFGTAVCIGGAAIWVVNGLNVFASVGHIFAGATALLAVSVLAALFVPMGSIVDQLKDD